MNMDAFLILVANICRAVSHRNGVVTYGEIIAGLHLRSGQSHPPRRVCEAAELAGFPVWMSAPDDAWKPY